MHFLQSFDISVSGLTAQRKRLDVIANNLANIETTRTEQGGPYRRKMVVMSQKQQGADFGDTLTSQVQGVQIEGIVEDPSSFEKAYNPAHPDADKEGYLAKPNVDLFVETINMLTAKRAFEANIAAIKTVREMTVKALEIGR